MKSRLRFLVLPALALASCGPVPFDLTLSQGVRTASRMTKDNPGSIVAGYNQGGSQTGYAFYPSVLAAGGFDYSAGFVTSMESSSIDLQAVAGGNQYGFTNQPLTNPDTRAPSVILWPLKSGQSFLFGVGFDSVNPTMSGYAIFQGTPSPPSLVLNPPPSGSGLQSLATLFGLATSLEPGATVYASSNPMFDYLHLLMFDTFTNLFLEGSLYVTAPSAAYPTGFTSAVRFRNGGGEFALPWIPSGITRVLYYYDEDVSRAPNRSFGQWWDAASSSWVTYTWWEQPVGTFYPVKLPVDHRIDALLTTGQLLSTEGETGRLYDRDGNLLATFALGNLVYIGEQYVGGVARAYFSQCLIFDKALHFNVYWIPTTQLVSLGS